MAARKFIAVFTVCALATLVPIPVLAQTAAPLVVQSCGSLPAGTTYVAAQTRQPTVDVNGNTCGNTSGGGGGAVTIANGADVALGTTGDTQAAGTVVGFLKSLWTNLFVTPVAIKVDGSGVTQPVSLAGTTPVLKNGLTNTASSVVSSVAATFTSYYVWNPNSTVEYVQIYDVATAGAVTVGTTTPKWSIGIPPTSGANISGLALAFANGIQVAATTTATGSTAPATALDANFGYK